MSDLWSPFFVIVTNSKLLTNGEDYLWVYENILRTCSLYISEDIIKIVQWNMDMSSNWQVTLLESDMHISNCFDVCEILMYEGMLSPIRIVTHLNDFEVKVFDHLYISPFTTVFDRLDIFKSFIVMVLCISKYFPRWFCYFTYSMC